MQSYHRQTESQQKYTSTMSFKQAIVATMMMLAAAASVDKVVAVSAVTTTTTVRRRVKASKNGPPPPPKGQFYNFKKKPKSSKKNGPTPSPVALPVLPPLPYRPTEFPTTTAPEPEPTDKPTEEPTPDPSASPTAVPVLDMTTPPTNEAVLDIPKLAFEEGFTVFVELLTAADYIGDLSVPEGSYTVFAPTDDAFELMDEKFLSCLLAPEGKAYLAIFLSYHVTFGEVYSQDLSNGQDIVMCCIGENIEIDIVNTPTNTLSVFINGMSEIVSPNLRATNGVLHGIDEVLMPLGT